MTIEMFLVIWAIAGVVSAVLVFPLAYRTGRRFRSFVDNEYYGPEPGLGAIISAIVPPLLLIAIVLCVAPPIISGAYRWWFNTVGTIHKNG